MSHFNTKWGISISKSAMSNILKESSKWISTEQRTASKLSDRGCANQLLEEVLYLWFITNGLVGKGGDIHGDIRDMAVELIKDPRFEVSSNFKFSDGWIERIKKWHNIKQYSRQGDGALILVVNV